MPPPPPDLALGNANRTHGVFGAVLGHQAQLHEDSLVQGSARLGEGGDGGAAALAAANAGISVGTTALASDSADVVMMSAGDLTSVDKALSLGHKVTSTARLGVCAGMGCSLVQMALAHAGVLSPLANACLQEGVDLAAILNSLSVLFYTPL